MQQLGRHHRWKRTSFRPVIIVAAVLAGFGPAVAPAWATCGATNCFLVTGTQEGIGLPGTVTVDISYRYVVMSRKMAGTHDVGEVLTPKVDFENGILEPDHHREISTRNTLVEVDLAYAATRRLTFALGLPVINQRDHEHFDDVGTPEEHFTNSDGSSGFGDVRLGARLALLVKPKDILVGGLAVKLPTGQYRLLDGEGAINEPTIQPGTGSTDLIATLHYTHQIAPMVWEYFLSGSYRHNGGNDLDYTFGTETVANAGIVRRTGPRIAWSVQVNARRTLRDEFRGMSVPSTGSTFVNLTPGVRLTTAADNGTSLYGFVQVPIHQEVNETNLAPRTGFLFGVSKQF